MRDERNGSEGSGRAFAVTVACALLVAVAQAFQPVPKESAKALGVTRGRAFNEGAVFINGKYVAPPYVVERWGTGIRVNSQFVTGQVIDWTEFLKTQSGVRTNRTETAAASAAPAPAASAGIAKAEEDSLDDLFDDNPKPKKQAAAPAVSRPVAPAKSRAIVSYSLEGEFVPNESTRAMLARINASRTEIDRILRAGGFICFGNSYSRVSGDSRMLLQMLEKLPELQQRSPDVQAFSGGVRAAGMVYLNEVLREDLFRNRVDYRRLMELRKKLRKKSQWDAMLNDVPQSLF